jgi:voltage-gated potassium channel Kch
MIARLQSYLTHGWVARHRGKLLLASLIALVIISPAVDVSQSSGTLATLNSTVFIAGLLSLGLRRHVMLIGLLLGAPFILAAWIGTMSEQPAVHATQLISGAAFFGYIAIILLRVLFRDRHVTADHLFGAAAAYMLVAAAWGFLYTLVNVADADAFTAAETLEDADLFYFSIVTLTTLGYGDISPAAPIARALAAIEAMVGVMFIAIIVSRLVGTHNARLQLED